jgi:hypothetical protein
MEVPTHKVAEHEEIKAECKKFFEAGKKITKIAKGIMKDLIITKGGFDNKARKRTDEAKKNKKNKL